MIASVWCFSFFLILCWLARGVSEEEGEILIDVEVEGDEDEYEAHDSQMLSDDEDDGEERDHDITLRGE